MAEIKQFILEHPKIDNEQILIVNFDRFADSALEIKILCMVSEIDSKIFLPLLKRNYYLK